jgi:hypothetical protein
MVCLFHARSEQPNGGGIVTGKHRFTLSLAR